MNFELVNWWVLPVSVIVGASIIAAFYLYKAKVKSQSKTSNTVLVANSVRMRNTPAYMAAVKKLWIQLITLSIVFAVVGLLAAVGASKPAAVSVDHPQKHNRDISLCLDASGSMFDVNISILEKFKELVTGFKGERISLTVFNATSMQVFPLTDDYDYIDSNLNKVIEIFKKNYNDPEAAAFLASTLGREEGASLVGDGLYSCSLSFDNRQDEKRSRSIILASDNVVNGKELVKLDEAAQIAKDSNIRVYGINPGNRKTVLGFVSDSALKSMKSAVEVTGGKFFELKDNNATATIIDEISSTETTMIEGSPMVVKKDQPELILYLITGSFIIALGLIVWRKL